MRRYDAQHLILGTRLHDWSKYNKVVVEACARYCDVVSLNYYARWQPEPEFMANLSAWCGNKPFLVSEFYTKADDATYNGQKYDNTEGGGWLVRTQKNRGEFYQNFCIRLFLSIDFRCRKNKPIFKVRKRFDSRRIMRLLEQ